MIRSSVAFAVFTLCTTFSALSLGQKVALGSTSKNAIEKKYLVVSGPFYIGNHNCSQGLHRAPSGPFTAFLFCNAALGDYLGVVYEGYTMVGPRKGNWSISRRFWQEEPFSVNVTSFAWSKDGLRLYVGTSDIYGDGGFFELDLLRQKVKRLYPIGSTNKAPKSEYGSYITGYDIKTGKLDFAVLEYTAIGPQKVVSITVDTCDSQK